MARVNSVVHPRAREMPTMRNPLPNALRVPFGEFRRHRIGLETAGAPWIVPPPNRPALRAGIETPSDAPFGEFRCTLYFCERGKPPFTLSPRPNEFAAICCFSHLGVEPEPGSPRPPGKGGPSSWSAGQSSRWDPPGRHRPLGTPASRPASPDRAKPAPMALHSATIHEHAPRRPSKIPPLAPSAANRAD